MTLQFEDVFHRLSQASSPKLCSIATITRLRLHALVCFELSILSNYRLKNNVREYVAVKLMYVTFLNLQTIAGITIVV